jgi:hypothetical protein
VKAAPKNANLGVEHLINQTVLLVDAAGPISRQGILQRFGLPTPANGSRNTSRIILTMRWVCFRSVAIHHAKSSKASGSNSKLLKRFLEGNSLFAALGLQEALLHLRASEKIGGFAFRLDLAPQFNGHDDADRLSGFIGDVLDFAVSQATPV